MADTIAAMAEAPAIIASGEMAGGCIGDLTFELRG
jgi:hypothetical protein